MHHVDIVSGPTVCAVYRGTRVLLKCTMASAGPSPTSGRLRSFSHKLLRSPRKTIGHKLRKAVKRDGSKGDGSVSDHRLGVGLARLSIDGYGKHAGEKPKVVVAIDFGTTYSGYAYAFTHSPDEIHLMRRSDPGQYGTMSHKTPTILLLNERESFHSFGYEAREAYHALEETDSRKWMYFEKFKMELHSRKELHRGIELEAANGETVLASHVFAHALRYFKDCCLRELNEQCISHLTITPEQIQWVITVPAIWRQSAKQFMRHAALQAGLVTPDHPKQLIIALEPEAASIYCRKLRLREIVPDPLSSLPPSASPSPSTGAPKYKPSAFSGSIHSQPPHSTHCYSYDTALSQPTSASASGYAADFKFGMRYLVADCGGGTVDLTVHELEEQGRLSELYKATGGAWGSMGIDYQFEMLLIDIFGEEFIIDFIQNKPISWLEMIMLFEAKKKSFSPHKHLAVNIPLPFVFIEYHREKMRRTVESVIQSYGDDSVQWSSQGTLRLQPSIMMALFDPVVSEIIHHIQELLLIPELSRIEYLFLVGGFAESAVLQEAVRNAFRSHLRVVIPQDVSLTIVKGAVMFGLDPTLVHVRRSFLTYGVGCLHRFVPGKHPLSKRVIKGGIEWCTDVFDTFVFADQAVSLGHKVTRGYTTANADQQSTTITLFASDKEFVRFVTDRGVSKVAELKLEMPDLTGTGGRGRELRMSMMFGDTEISVEAIDCTSGQIARASIDFLNK